MSRVLPLLLLALLQAVAADVCALSLSLILLQCPLSSQYLIVRAPFDHVPTRPIARDLVYHASPGAEIVITLKGFSRSGVEVGSSTDSSVDRPMAGSKRTKLTASALQCSSAR